MQRVSFIVLNVSLLYMCLLLGVFAKEGYILVNSLLTFCVVSLRVRVELPFMEFNRAASTKICLYIPVLVRIKQ